MRLDKSSFPDLFGGLTVLSRRRTNDADNARPLRAELLSVQQLEQYGTALAERHRLSDRRTPDRLLQRLADNERVIAEASTLQIAAVQQKRQITPAAEWLVDNFQLIDEQIKLAKRHLPKGYSRGLPRLDSGDAATYPRVYALALELVAHGDGRVEAEGLTRFIAAYQRVTPLKLGELWAVPIMLRLALIENLRRVAVQLADSRRSRDRAESWADQMVAVAQNDQTNLIVVTADMARAKVTLDSAFVSEITRRLQGQGPALALPLTWIEQRLAQAGQTTENLVRVEAQILAADQVSVSNSIGSLRFLATMNWRNFVEAISPVEATLRGDPAGYYEKMDFATRDHYRHCVERLAKMAGLLENDVARQALALAHENATNGLDERESHVGYYLIGDGLPRLEQMINTRRSLATRGQDFARRHPLTLYLGAIALLTCAVTAGFVAKANEETLALRLAVATLGIAGASQLAIGLVNWASTLVVRPKPLPRLDFTTGIPAEYSTLVVVPTLLTRLSGIDALVEDLEVRFLGNRSPALQYALLTDFADASAETMPEDAALLARAREAIDHLNKQYAGEGKDIFFLLHRARRWNAQEQVWMGHERKRGKLADLNHFLRGKSNNFAAIAGRAETLATGIRYVITLDTDTDLPRDAARQFVGALAHPLNRAYYDPAARRVTRGYGILQPRVAVSLPGTDASAYARFNGGEPGIDPYTRAVSDVYQDIFEEGSFIGKGIYDVDAFEAALGGQMPDNRILSHDLLEGCYARAGLLSDAQLYEAYPSRYSDDVARRHRWIRGDWQLAAWVLPRVPGLDKRVRNPLTGLSRWKIFDNLRRSIVPQALLLLLAIGWTSLPDPWFWTGAVIGILAVPSLSSILFDLTRKSRDLSLATHLRYWARAAGRNLGQALFNLTVLPYDAFYMTDAILRASWRLLISRRLLLEWNPSGEAGRHKSNSLASTTRLMLFAPLLALVLAVALYQFQSGSLPAAAPVLILWLLSPILVWRLSQPAARHDPVLTDRQTAFLHRTARRTWAFFETYVGPDDNWLPPDNVQDYPATVVAHRTSPTNMGLSLLANLAAYDFGYIPAGQAMERVGNTLAIMEKLERHRGHFYNWYETTTLAPLLPIYISTVDSGNLAGHLITLRAGLQALSADPVISPRLFEGLRDTFGLIVEASGGEVPPALREADLRLQSACRLHPSTPRAIHDVVADIADAVRGFSAPADASADAVWWARALGRQCRQISEELLLLAPWLMSGGVSVFLELNSIPTWRDLAQYDFDTLVAPHPDAPLDPHDLATLRAEIAAGAEYATTRIAAMEKLAAQAGDFAVMEYDFLYDRDKHLLSIGYALADRRRDPGYYDLLASEARLCNFVAIAQDQVPQDSWFALGRQLVGASSRPVLRSWSGSMFEYLMPLLVMPNFEHTLLDQTYRNSVARQIAYGEERGVPWGISESGYHLFDASLNYQYRAFGVPDLGIKRGLADDLVIAPYATVMALMVAPGPSCRNLEHLQENGFSGRYGFYEAIDYTPARLPRGANHALIQSYMVHHQGMGFLALAYRLLDQPMQKRFAAEPIFQSAMLLLHEKIPKASVVSADPDELAVLRAKVASAPEASMRIVTKPDTPAPEIQLLSNGRYHVMVSNSGGSQSRWQNLNVLRWREDATRDPWGLFCYIRDVTGGDYWSNTFQPTRQPGKHYEAIFSEGRVEFRRRDGEFETHTEIVVSPEDDIELRRLRITNRARSRRTIEVTSYGEVVIAPAPADAAHPAFSNLFVQTEIQRQRRAILCSRRARSNDENPPWMFQLMAVHGGKTGEVSYETDRLQFIGRGNSPLNPRVMRRPGVLSGSQGSVLDPVAAIRTQITLEAEETVIIDLVTGMHDTRDGALGLVDRYQDYNLASRVFEVAWTHSQVVLRQLGVTEADAQLYGRMASAIVYPDAAWRASAGTLMRNRRGQSGLWGHAISGDFPIALVKIRDGANIELVRTLVQAHAYWRQKGLSVDLVIWNEDAGGYRQLLQDQILGLIAAGTEAQTIDKPGGIFVRVIDQISPDDRVLIESVARMIFSDQDGTLAEQMTRPPQPTIKVPRLNPGVPVKPNSLAAPAPALPLQLANGLGGFSADGREYVVMTGAHVTTPMPWSNVIANPDFGTVISESGGAYSWSENAQMFRLTPWNNDPVTDASGEAYYIRDEESGQYWSPAPLPAKGVGPYVTRHGFGYTVFEHEEGGIASELQVYVAMNAPVKFALLKIRNNSGRRRKISATGYVEWVLGDQRSKTAPYIITEIDEASGAIFARNNYNTEFENRVAFFDVDGDTRTLTGDRREFIGRNGTLQEPSAMRRVRLSNRVGAGLDPCAALQVAFDLSDGQEREIVFRLGVGATAEAASQLARQHRGWGGARTALEGVRQHWDGVLSSVQVDTPDPALNIMANGWLMYQTISSRLWARSGYYQSGGAFGFRDQLQDAMAAVHTRPDLLRAQLLLCAAHQFTEGDVQHWWHPPADRGVRTKCSDDYLWLPLGICRYLSSTGDTAILEEQIHFLEGRPLGEHEESYYDLPTRSAQMASLYEHCVRALEHGMRYGVHGLPLIGSCDWNDGMDKIGEQGKGESVWLGFFLYDILQKFAPVATARGDAAFAHRCAEQAAIMRGNIEANAWDGAWYRRAYFDDGTPLGSAANDECQIDSLSQSWAVLSGAGDPARARQAMGEVDTRLVRRADGLIQLLDPPFDKSAMNPGYIRGYVPGVRENGGQYTHAAVWTAMAFAEMGDHDKAFELAQMINPISHSLKPADTARYKVEPYVITADIYGVAPHIGRGGWSWYTGSAGWFYRLIIESILGLHLEPHGLTLDPRLPSSWTGFKARYRHGGIEYVITVERADGTAHKLVVDDVTIEGNTIPFASGQKSSVAVRLTLPR